MEQTLGKRISANRKRLRLTQDQLAEQLGVTAQAVSKWENDQSCPDIATLPRLAEIFGITVGALLGCETDSAVHETEVVAAEEYDCGDDCDTDTPGIHLQNDGGKWDFRWDAGRKDAVGLGLWVLSVGVLFLCSKLLKWETNLWGILWPSGILLFGILGLFRRRFSFFRLGCAVFGGYFLVENLAPGLIPLSTELILPILLILWGLSLVADALRKGRISGPRLCHKGKRVGSGNFSSNFSCRDEQFSCDCSFGDENRKICLPRLSRGVVDVSFGNARIDLSGVEAVSTDCSILADVSFGEITLEVPRRFRVELDPSSSFGNIELQGDADPDPQGTIRIHANASFGSICVLYI